MPYTRVEMRDDLRVTGGREHTAGALQLIAKLDVVVDFAILRDGDAAVDRDRLMSAGHIDDAQSGGAEPDGAVEERAVIVRAAVPQCRDHPRDPLRIRSATPQRDDARDSTHGAEGVEKPRTSASSAATKPATRLAERPSKNWHCSAATARRPSRSSDGSSR